LLLGPYLPSLKAQREAGEGGARWLLVLRMVDWERVVRPPVIKPTTRIPAVPQANVTNSYH